MASTHHRSIASSGGVVNKKNEPDHLLVLVHGILASPSDWTYVEAELKRRLERNFLIYASSSNTYTKTFTGINGTGKRLAEEVLEVVQKTESVIFFFIFSTFSRKLTSSAPFKTRYDRRIGASEFFYFGNTTSWRERAKAGPFYEKLTAPVAPFLVGRTGSQLFLTDGHPNKCPLLLRMASDCEDGKFISALGAFKNRILYANVSYDHMVGWRTSSVRREAELPKTPCRSLDGYKHVVDVEYCPPVSSDGPQFPPKAAKAKEAAQNAPTTKNTVEYHEIMEEEMIHGLQQLGWKKVDVSFHSAFWPYFAHNNIHVKNEWFHNAGAGVVAHVAESLKQQESTPFITANL